MNMTRNGGPELIMKSSMVWVLGLLLVGLSGVTSAADGVYVRFKLLEPADAKYYVQFGGNIHVPNWGLPGATFPAEAKHDAEQRFVSGEHSDWFDIKTWAGELLHGRMNRSGGSRSSRM
ncbi:MAG: hypothetical protein CMJ49_14845 [Planctomycetaceae bacterium]|nr:hypothetical protein [Planctomycetaceae bacterium]